MGRAARIVFEGDALPRPLELRLPSDITTKAPGDIYSRISCVGVFEVDNDLVFSLPRSAKNFELEAHAFNTYLRIFLRALKKYSRRIAVNPYPSGRAHSNEVRSQGNILDRLSVEYALLDDFDARGLYVPRAAIWERSKTGRIDWKRTVKPSHSLFQSDDGFAARLFYRRRVSPSEHPLVKLQLETLKFLRSLHGLSVQHGLPEVDQPLSQDRLVTLADQNLSRAEDIVSDDRGKRLIQLFREFFDRRALSSLSENNQCWFYLETFDYLWEDLVKVYFSDYGVLRRASLPTGQWRDAAGRETSGITPRADLLLELPDEPSSSGGKRRLLLVDAKNKALIPGGYSGSAGDHYKQVFYAALVEDASAQVIANVLVLPSDSVLDQFRGLKVIGAHRWENIANSRVFEASLSVTDAMIRYIGQARRFDRTLEELLAFSKSS